jgi:hypothetical protein
MARWVSPILGIVALLALLGLAEILPPQVAFFVGGLTVILFPGLALTHLVAGRALKQDTLPERLAVWFVAGIGVLSLIGLLGLVLKLYLRDVIVICILAYAALIVVLVLRAVATRGRVGGGEPGRARLQVSPIAVLLIAVAVGMALITLVTPRDYDDWYYLAYIKDYTAGKQLASEDAIFDMGNPVTPRIWFGGGWWVLEAMLARVCGADPIACHQIYLPILVLPFAVFAVYTLARRLFRSAWPALLACGFQMLFYLSSAYPFKSTGWMVFARMAQDKTVACFVVAPVAAALALRLFGGQSEHSGPRPKGPTFIYWIVALTSALVHGMGPVWCGLFIVPFAMVEWLRTRTRAATLTSVKAILPILACAAILMSVRGLLKQVVIMEPQDIIPAPGPLAGLYLPGMPFKLGTDTTNPIAWMFHESFFTLNPLFIMRYPIAIAGLVLTFALSLYVRSSLAARFLLALTASVLLLVFTPFGIAFVASVITQRLVFRLIWIMPWGLIIAFFIARLRLRPVLNFLVLAAAVLALAGGNPANYGALFAKMHGRNRPSPDAAAVFGYLASKPTPQGVILASEATGRMIPAFLPDAYPVNFRELGPIDREKLAQVMATEHIGQEFIGEMDQHRVGYIVIEANAPLAKALDEDNARFVLEYSNPSYRVWRRDLGLSR